VLRKGFRHGDRLLRPALVTVADPVDEPPAATAEPVAPTDLPAPDLSTSDLSAPDLSGPDLPEADAPAGDEPSAPEPPAAAWTPPKSAPGGSATAQPRVDPGADAGEDEDDGTPVIWFGEPGEQQQD
jgi:hypothetical protein